MAELSEAFPGQLKVIEGDALELPLASVMSGPCHIASNLPYNVGTALLIGWLSGQDWPRLAMKVHRSAFTPPPKVMSAIVHLTPAAMPEGIKAARLEAITAAAFGQRRKMLRQSLKGLPGALAALEAVGIDPARRAETLSVDEFLAVARAMETA